MRTPEIDKHSNQVTNRGWDWILGVAGVTIVNCRSKKVVYEGSENILKINESLVKGDSVLLVADHSGNDETGNKETLISAGFVPRYLNNRQISGIIIREGTASREMGLEKRILFDTFVRLNVELLVVKTPKYEHDDNIRAGFNYPPTKRATKILGKPGGLVLIYSSGTRSPTMLPAEDGVPFLSAFADWVVPMTTVVETGAKPRVIIHEPMPGKDGVRRCMQEFGREAGKQTYSDLIMAIIAAGQPIIVKRGFYEGMAEQLERYMRNPTEFTPRFEDEREQKMMTAYILWRAGGFENSVR
jgi:hypothetical protein